MRAVLLLISLGLLQSAGSARVKLSPQTADQSAVSFAGRAPGQVCKIAEKQDGGRGLYQIGFTFNVKAKSCSNNANCNFWHMKDLVKQFLDKPVPQPANGATGQCKCNLKQFDQGESAQVKALPGVTGPRTLVTFVSHAGEPCNEITCWAKYNQFLYLNSRDDSSNANFRNESTNANHWNIGCADGEASLAGLKTVREMRDEAPIEQKLEMIKHAQEAQILPDSTEDELEALKITPKDAFVDHSAFVDKSIQAGAILVCKIPEDEDEEDLCEVFKSKTSREVIGQKEPGDRVIATGPAQNGMIPIQYPADPSGTGAVETEFFELVKKDDEESIRRKSEEERGEIQADMDSAEERADMDSPEGVRSIEEALPAAATEALKRAVTVMSMVEVKMTKMLSDSIEFERVAALMAMGKASEALDANWQRGEVLIHNMNVLARVTSYNMNNVIAFRRACEVTTVPAEVVEEVLATTKKALEVQSAVRRSLSMLEKTAAEALQHFKAHDGVEANNLAKHVKQQLATLKWEVRTNRGALQKALRKIHDE